MHFGCLVLSGLIWC